MCKLFDYFSPQRWNLLPLCNFNLCFIYILEPAFLVELFKMGVLMADEDDEKIKNSREKITFFL